MNMSLTFMTLNVVFLFFYFFYFEFSGMHGLHSVLFFKLSASYIALFLFNRYFALKLWGGFQGMWGFCCFSPNKNSFHGMCDFRNVQCSAQLLEIINLFNTKVHIYSRCHFPYSIVIIFISLCNINSMGFLRLTFNSYRE